MKTSSSYFRVALAVALTQVGLTAWADEARIDRHALVTRHNVEWNDLRGVLGVGNGEFCFGADATGLQTFSGNTMSHWAWHSFPLPPGISPKDVPENGSNERGRLERPPTIRKGEPLYDWMAANPHSFNLGRLRLLKTGGEEWSPRDFSEMGRKLDLWSGVQCSSYKLAGIPVRVETCVHPALDLVAVRVQTALLKEGRLEIGLDFPYPVAKSQIRPGGWIGDFTQPGMHQTRLCQQGQRQAALERALDGTGYQVKLAWSGDQARLAPLAGAHRYALVSRDAETLEFVCAFSSKGMSGSLPGFDETKTAAAAHWAKFWSSGGAIDLSASKDPRWRELERRIVLSQYLMAAQSAGSYPSAEIGLHGIDAWNGQFHMEMLWWHEAHFGLWDRWTMAGEALDCYRKFLPLARKLAAQFGYRGAKWGKQVGPEGRTVPAHVSYLLHWQQPHPIFLAEMAYRLNPSEALSCWKDIVLETADYMADFPVLDEKSGLYSLKPVITAAENGVCSNPAFELAYWRYGLDMAQKWRERLGLAREPRWDKVRARLAPLPVQDGVFVYSPDWTDTYSKRNLGHPDPIGPFAFLPFVEGVDRAVAERTVKKVYEQWQWNSHTWGWDFPWLAMAAARAGQPEMAVEALFTSSGANQYPPHGINGGWYLPGNGGLLYAVAMMAAGWDGAPDRHAPGFPDNGQWTVKWEGLKRAQ